ncbi:DsbA family protein [Phenylobacterium sp.]|uniref:DsbA family protein n=1 Tax=Phenylobacterium sp. TaxID=1871053 RepID=UPI00121B0877|nr:DsbA family protein [Phenylobacterium sp.]THD68503.1 MAG: DsbA family protein [Phenylobacterium sp.]
MNLARPILAAALAAVLAAGGLALDGCAKKPLDAASVAQPGDMSLGNPAARVKVIEYASASCPHCARWDMDVFPAFKAKYVDTGKVSYTLKEYLTEPQALAAAGFLLARCAGPDRYFPVLDAVFRGQDDMVRTGDPRAVLARIAADPGGMTPAQLDACMRDTTAEKQLAARVERHAHVDKIDSTPTFIINGVRIEGEMSLPELDAAIAKAAG